MAQPERDAGTPVPYAHRWPPMRADLVVVGAGAAGLYAALCAAREGARVTLVSARPLAETASYWAQGGAGRRARRRGLARAPPRGHARRRPRARAPRRPPRCCATRRPSASATSRRSACASTPTATATLALGLEGGHGVRRVAHAGGSATGRRILRDSCRRVVAEHDAHRRARGPPRRRARHRTTAAASACSSTTAARSTPAPSCSPPAAPPRCGRARPTRPARSAPGCCSPAPPAPRSPTSSSPSSTRPRWSGCPGREGFLISEAVRGEGATLHDAATASASSTSSRRATPSRARSSRAARTTGRAGGRLDMRARRPRPLPERRRRAARGRPGPDRRSGSRSRPPATT